MPDPVSTCILFTETNGNAYATVDNMDLLMVANAQWQSMDGRDQTPPPAPETFAQRDALILAATNIIDSMIYPRGYKVDDSQLLKFPVYLYESAYIQNETLTNEFIIQAYLLSEQINRLRMAMFFQIESMLRQKNIGLANFLAQQGQPPQDAGFAPQAIKVLTPYMSRPSYD